LHAARDHADQQVLAESRRRRASEHQPPAAPKRMKGARAQPLDLSLDRSRLRRLMTHDYALGAAPVWPVPAAIRYTRGPSTFSERSLSPSFLRTTAARKPRTECGCQPVLCMMPAMVAPLGRLNSPITRICFECGRG